ncbi:unnamed protein product [Dibothriocephalus latus]|uniref:Uncharacterized protein n=1 Tax=Dibothriocephalus latus TaxID=60516 RepID=A0A3P7MIC6_DIBLA|nr:unnamed protein product [Dibothriocephalus latus]
MNESINLPDGLFNVKSICEASFPDFINSTRLLFSRAFFIDNFKGIQRENVRENAKKENNCDQESQQKVSVVNTRSCVKSKSNSYYKSLTYTLSLIKNSSEESSSTEDKSEGKEDVRPSQPQSTVRRDDRQEYPLTNSYAEPESELQLESETDEEDVIRQMQALGLPTSFGRQQ